MVVGIEARETPSCGRSFLPMPKQLRVLQQAQVALRTDRWSSPQPRPSATSSWCRPELDPSQEGHDRDSSMELDSIHRRS